MLKFILQITKCYHISIILQNPINILLIIIYNKQYMNPNSPQLIEAFKLKGYLDKKSSQILLGWQRRYWTVVGVDLLYYQDHSKKEIKGKFPIRKILSLQEEDKKIFTFIFQNRRYELRAETIEQRNTWVKNLKVLKRYTGDQVASQPNSPLKLNSSKSSSSLRDLSQVFSPQQNSHVIIKSEMCQCRTHSDVLNVLGLSQLSQKFLSKKVFNRISILSIKQGYLFVLSCKSLSEQYEDGDIWSQEEVHPFQLNSLYRCKFGNDKVKQICKCSTILSVEYQQTEKILKINHGKRSQFVAKEDGKEFQKKLKKAIDIGREYHNSKNICLNINISPLLKIYETNQGSECRQKVKIYLENKYSMFLRKHPKQYKDFSSFKQFFGFLVSFEKDYLNAFQVSNSKNHQMISEFQQFIHIKIHRVLSDFWDQKHHLLSSQDIFSLAILTDQYRRSTLQYSKDLVLDIGIGTLIKMYLRSVNIKLLKFIQKLRESLSEVSFSQQIYNFLHRQVCSIISKCQSKQSLVQVVQFIQDAYKIWIQELYLSTEKQNNPEIIAQILKEINDFNGKVFTELKNQIISSGLQPLSFDDSLSETDILLEQRNLVQHMIQRMFKLLFMNIDRSIISKNLMQVDLEKLLHQINSKLNALRNIDDDGLKEIKRQIGNELLQYQLNLILQQKPVSQTKVSNIVEKISKDKTIIQKHLISLYDKQAVTRQTTILNDIIQFLGSDSLISIRKHFLSMKKIAPHLFSLVVAKNLIQLKNHLSKDQKSKLYSVCVDILSSDIEKAQVQSTVKESLMQSYVMPSRRSTLTLNLRHSSRPLISNSQKQTISGYLKKKKVDNRSIKRIYQKRYFTVLQGYMLWYMNESSQDLQNKLDLNNLKQVTLHQSKKQVFYLELEDCKYQFKAESEKLCQQWVRVLKGYVTSNTKESQAVTIHDDKEIFKDYQITKAKPTKVRMQSTRESVLSQLSEKEIGRQKYPPQPGSPLKSPTRSFLSQAPTDRASPLLKKQSLNVESNISQKVNGERGCWGWFKNCICME